MDYRELGSYQKARQVIQATNAELKSWPKTMQAQEIARSVHEAPIPYSPSTLQDDNDYYG